MDFSYLISVIVPSFNEEKHISRCLDSILNQTYKNIEIICIDDNSTDSTFDIISTYQKEHNNILLYKNPEKGVSSARNFGIEKAHGDYIGFVDSDDFIQPQMYEFLLRAIIENRVDMSVCRYNKTSEFVSEQFDYSCRECLADEFVNFSDTNENEKTELTFSSAWTKLVKVDYLKNSDKFLNYKIGEDTVFCANLWKNTDAVYLVDLPLYCYFVNTDSVSYTKVWDDKWFDLLETRFITFDILKNYKSSFISDFYLERGMKFILSYRFNIKKTENKNKYKKHLNKYFNKYIFSYLFSKNINFKNKIIIIVFYFLPPLYSAYRKKLDKTI